MKDSRRHRLILITAPNLRTARRLARIALQQRLVACVNLVPNLESHYWWKNRLESSREILLLAKTTRRNIAALETLILAQHPYDTPEFIEVPIAAGTARYLAWLEAEARPLAARRPRQKRPAPSRATP